MSEHAPQPDDDGPKFTPQEVAGFDADDAIAGRNIGRMLTLFFLYTVIAMSLVSYWTYCASSN